MYSINVYEDMKWPAGKPLLVASNSERFRARCWCARSANDKKYKQIIYYNNFNRLADTYFIFYKINKKCIVPYRFYT